MKDEDKISVDGYIDSALKKKAFGFDATEIVEEYALSEEGEIKLSKKKVTTKFVPPDVVALKMLIEKAPSLTDYSDEELAAEKERLLDLLYRTEKKNKEKPKCKKKKDP